MRSFKIPNNIVFGEESFKYLEKIKGERAMIVTGGSSMRKNGFLDQAQKYLENAGLKVQIFDGVESNPSVETILRGKEAMLEFQPDWIVAIGGGSSLDAGKIMWTLYEQPDLVFEDLLDVKKFPKLRNKARLVCIPSTSGTASEITAFAVITDSVKHVKYAIGSYEIIPDIAILDPILPSKMPLSITSWTGMDALTHATEAIISTKASDFTDGLAMQAIKMVFEYLPKVYAEPDNLHYREKMHNASAMAGMAFSTAMLGINHSLAHSIGATYGIAHGLANAIPLPYVVQYNRKATNKIDWIEKELGIEDYPTAIKALNTELNVPLTYKDCDINNLNDRERFYSDIDRLSELAFNDVSTVTNPRETGPADIKKLFEYVFEGKDVDF